MIASVKEGFGFIRCADREARMFFHFSEMMDASIDVCIGEEVQFTVIQARIALQYVGIRTWLCHVIYLAVFGNVNYKDSFLLLCMIIIK